MPSGTPADEASAGGIHVRHARDVTLQAGVSVVSGDRLVRVGIEVHDGRPSLGEFFQDDETYTALGLWIDF